MIQPEETILHSDKIYIETPRLLLRKWKKEDLLPFSEMNSDKEVMRYFPKTLTFEESEKSYNTFREEIERYDYGLFAIEVKDDHQFAGFTGFHHFNFNVSFAPGIEIGWRLKSNYWNKGYATEAAKACLEYAKKQKLFKEIYSFTATINKPSEKVMQKIGMQKTGEFDHPNVPDHHPLKKHVLYKIEL